MFGFDFTAAEKTSRKNTKTKKAYNFIIFNFYFILERVKRK